MSLLVDDTPFEQPESFGFTPENLDRAKAHIAKYPPGRRASAVLPLTTPCALQSIQGESLRGWDIELCANEGAKTQILKCPTSFRPD
jgi:NADH:ubiquinone oxidoreductase subunit E